MSRSSSSHLGTLGLAVAVALAAGCAKKEAEPARQAGPNHIVVTAADYAFQAPDSITAGLEMFHLVNQGPSIHHIQIVQLDSGKTLADLMTALKNPGPPPAWAHMIGGPNAAAPTGVDTTVAYLTLAAGNYALICLVPDSAGVPHFVKGMARALVVTPSAATPATEPQADVVVHLTDYAFAVTGSLTAGTHTIRVVNDGPQAHEMVMASLAPRKKATDLVKWVDAGMRGMPPGKPIGGTSALDPHGHVTLAATFAKGNYALICFLPDAKDGKEHSQHGMVKDLTVN
jgi:uncharacterized cupredoxin-like copper-binding protein